jgi:hypothetical protein
MATSPWLAYIIPIILVTVGLPVLLLGVPETIDIQSSKTDVPSNLGDENNHREIAPLDEPPDSELESNLSPERSPQSTKLEAIFKDYRFLKNPSILMLLSTFCLYWVGRSQMDLLVQYIFTRYDRSLSSAGFIISMNAAISLILLLVILPFIGKYLQNTWRFSSAVVDLWVLKGSIIILTIGCISIGIAPILPAMLVGDALFLARASAL